MSVRPSVRWSHTSWISEKCDFPGLKLNRIASRTSNYATLGTIYSQVREKCARKHLSALFSQTPFFRWVTQCETFFSPLVNNVTQQTVSPTSSLPLVPPFFFKWPIVAHSNLVASKSSWTTIPILQTRANFGYFQCWYPHILWWTMKCNKPSNPSNCSICFLLIYDSNSSIVFFFFPSFFFPLLSMPSTVVTPLGTVVVTVLVGWPWWPWWWWPRWWRW